MFGSLGPPAQRARAGPSPSGAILTFVPNGEFSGGTGGTVIALSRTPEAVQTVIPPLHFGANTLFLKSVGAADGETLVTWQRGRLVFTVVYNSVPGYAAFAPAVRIARALDARYQQQPLP